MDPDQTLADLRSLADDIGEADPDGIDDLLRIVELFTALDEWLSRGGFPPAAWRTR